MTRAFSSEVDTGSREENASKHKDRAPFRFNRNGKGSRDGASRQTRNQSGTATGHTHGRHRVGDRTSVDSGAGDAVVRRAPVSCGDGGDHRGRHRHAAGGAAGQARAARAAPVAGIRSATGAEDAGNTAIGGSRSGRAGPAAAASAAAAGPAAAGGIAGAAAKPPRSSGAAAESNARLVSARLGAPAAR